MSRYRTGQETLKGESEWHPSAEVCLASKSQFGTPTAFGDDYAYTLVIRPKCRISIMWALAQRPSGDDYAYPFRSFRKRMRPDSNPNRLYLFFRVFWPL